MGVFKSSIFILVGLIFMFDTIARENLVPEVSSQAVESILRTLEGKKEKIEVAYCYEIICCKTTNSGSKYCKTACGTCPIGWFPDY
jgi:hypothetical protein